MRQTRADAAVASHESDRGPCRATLEYVSRRTRRFLRLPDVAPDMDNLAQGYRDRAIMLLGIPVTLFVMPFAINHFLQGRPLMGLFSLAVLVETAANSLQLYRGRRPPVPVFVFALTLIVALVWNFLEIGAAAIFWAYPVMLMFHFVATRRVAYLLSVLLLASFLPLGFGELGVHTGMRFGATLALVALFGAMLVGIIIDLQNRLTEIAVRDPLTGAFNRLQFDARLEEEAERMRRGAGPTCLIALDIDYFKAINDDLGHAAGDRVLRDIVAVIRRRLRKTDMVFRVGGEEFTVLLANTPLSGASAFAEELRKRVRETALVPGRRVTVSIGVAELQAGEDVQAWQRRADDLLYAAKHSGRDQVAWLDSTQAQSGP